MKMGEYCEEPSTKWMKTKLLQHYDRQILIVNKYGKRDIVMFYDAACDTLHDDHKMERSENKLKKKQRLVRAELQTSSKMT